MPVLIQAFPDEPHKMLLATRRDSFCGKISACNNLWQYGIRYTLTRSTPSRPARRPSAPTCGIRRHLPDGERTKNLRVGVLGARPAAFNTVRFSEKLLEQPRHHRRDAGPVRSVRPHRPLKDDDPEVPAKLAGIQSYVSTQGVPAASLVKMAKFGVVVDAWMKRQRAGRQPPSSAGPPWRSSSAWCPAR